METKSIAKNLIYQRKLQGYSQEKLAEKATVTVRTIQRIEKGDVSPHLETIKLLAVGLGIEVNDLLILEDPKQETLQMKWLLLMHGLPLLGLVLPLFNILLPLFLWIHKREDNSLYDTHGRSIINFQITQTLLYILSFIALLTVPGVGFLFFVLVIPYGVIVIVANILYALNSGKCFYPLAFPFLKKRKPIHASFLWIALLLLGSSLVSCTEKREQNINRLDTSLISKDSLTNKIQQLVTDAEVHGLAITLFEENKISYQKTFGYKDFDKKLFLTDTTNMYGASFSKAIFGVLVMKLVEENVIDLDTPLASYLPKKIYEYKPLTRWHDDFSALKTDSLYHKITARMCLNHTTGFKNYRWAEKDYQLRVNFEPGSRYSYSGEGLIYLQVVLEKMLGIDLETLAQEKIFKPLGMNNSSYQWNTRFEKDFAYGHTTSGVRLKKDIDNEPRGGGTLETSSGDYSIFLEAALQGKILAKSSWNELFRPQIRIRSTRQFGPLAAVDSDLNDAIKLSYGLGWGILETPYGRGAFKEGHGNGFQHYSIIFPKAKKGIMIMTNSDNGESIFEELLEVALKDTFTPSEWENYIPYNKKEVIYPKEN